MTEATILHNIETNLSGEEKVILECSDDETYTSRKFKQIDAAFISYNLATGDFTDEFTAVTISGQVATMIMLGTDKTDVKVILTLYGRTG